MENNAPVRPPGKEHIPIYPHGFIVLRILQFAFSVVLIGLVGWSVALLPFNSSIFMLYTVVITFGVTLWHIVAHFWAPLAYNYWAVLAFEIKLVIFWLVSFAYVAGTASWWRALAGYRYYRYDYDYDYDNAAFGSLLAATAGVGAIEFVFFVASLIVHSIVVSRHRRDGFQNKPIRASSTPPQPAPVPVQVATGAFQPQQQSQAYNTQPTSSHIASNPGFIQQQPVPDKQQISPITTPSPPPNQPQMFQQPQPIATIHQFPQGYVEMHSPNQQHPQSPPPQSYVEMYAPQNQNQQPPPTQGQLQQPQVYVEIHSPDH